MTKLFLLPGGLICGAVGLTEDSFRSRQARFLERGHFTVQGHVSPAGLPTLIRKLAMAVGRHVTRKFPARSIVRRT